MLDKLFIARREGRSGYLLSASLRCFLRFSCSCQAPSVFGQGWDEYPERKLLDWNGEGHWGDSARGCGFRTSRGRENKIKPGDLDRIGHLLEAHLRTGEGKAVVVEALDMIIDANQVKGARRLLDVVREIAQENKGTVLVQLNPSSLPLAERTRLEEGATVLHY